MTTFARLREHLESETDVAGLVAFRVLFGLLGFVSAVRFLVYGWAEPMFERPTFFFSFYGFEWVKAPPAPWATVLLGVVALSSLCVALGLFYRVAIVVFLCAFSYLELVDVTNYLNHYYLVMLLAFIASFLPLHRAFSLDVVRDPLLRVASFPTWMTWWLRAQITIVYVHAGLAKFGSDWLLHAEPLRIWLASRSHLPLIGPFVSEPWLPYAMSWAGFLYDTTIPFFLMHRRTRPYAFVVLLAFHAMTRELFMIGMFPFIMTVAATVFFDANWPRRFVPARLRMAPGAAPAAITRLAPNTLPLVGLFCVFQALIPLRTHLYGGNVLWHEQGMRWSWRVMVRAKNGSVSYRVRSSRWEGERLVSPAHYLTSNQEREMSAQPDMILSLAHHIARTLRAEGHERVEVRADAFASLNGRPMARLVDGDVDLARVEDSLLPATWILPAPTSAPGATAPLRISENRR